MLKKINLSILLLILLLMQSQQTYAQTVLNDGRIRIRVWLHKVWTNANCDDLGDQEYVFRDIRVRPSSDITSLGWSPLGLNLRADGDENRWWGINEWAGLQTPGGNANYPMSTDGNGVLMMDVTYNTTQVPKYFDWCIREMFEDDHTDCPWPCDGGTNPWIYNRSFCCGALNDDNYVGYNEELAVASFRSAPPGEVRYIQSKMYGGGEQESYALIFAYRWDWVDPLPPLPDASVNESSGGVRYQDGPITLQVDLMGLFSDSDYDYAPFSCTFGLADDEDLRLKWRATDNLTPFSGGSVCINSLEQPWPRWNNGNPITTLFTKTYTAADTEFESFNLEFEYWEEDGCGSDCTFDNGCFLGIENDDAYDFKVSGPVFWRGSIPTYSGTTDQWNYLDFPFKTSSSRYDNWSIRVRYKWVQAAPVVNSLGTFDRTLCAGTPTQLNITATSATYYQWQVAEPPAVTGPAGPACPPDGTVWTNIPGAHWKNFTPPQTPGTRIYRCVAFNRTGEGSYTPSGSKFRETYSSCYRITYFPYAPPIVSNACGTSIVGGIAYPFSVPVDPEPGAVANPSTYQWTVNPSAGVVISNPNSPTTTISFPQSDNSTPYTITLTVTDICGNTTSSNCSATITSDYCGIIYVAPPAAGGNNANIGSPIAPVATIAQAISIANNSGGGRTHIKILEGSYTEGNVMNLLNNLTVEGGYRLIAGEWIKSSAATTSINMSGFESSAVTGSNDIEHRLGWKANGVNNWTLQDLTIITTDVGGQTPSGRGRSNYAVWVNNSSGYNIVRCDIQSGAASDGADGVTPGGLGGAGGGGSGGNGANGSEDRCGCGGHSGSSPGGAGNGGAGGGSNGGNCCGGGCNWVGCDAGGCSAGGGNGGQRGGDGGSYGIGDRPATPAASGAYFVPSDAAESGGNGTGGGGGGGGGGGDIGTCCTCSCGSGRPNGGRGGDGGGGGLGGPGGKGGGSTFAIYRNNSNTGTLTNNRLIFGSAGVGGDGAPGQAGRPGDPGTPGVNHGGCDGGRGGNGGNGGDGGNGGRGRDGANGFAAGLCSVNGGVGSISTPSTAIPAGEITAQYKQGCSNSEITFTTPFSSSAFTDLGTDGDIVRNITNVLSTYSATDDPLIVYYSSTGRKDPVINGSTFYDFVHVNTSRTPPSIDGLPTGLCFNNTTINLASTANSPTVPTEFEWTIQRMPVTGLNTPVPLFTFNVEDPGEITLPTNAGCPNIFQIKLRVKDECCGWSIPVYHYISVENPTNNNTITAPAVRTFCTNGDPAIINGSVPTGGTCSYQYQWQLSTNGGPFNDITGANAPSYDPPVLNTTGTYQYYRIETSGACGRDTSNTITLEVVDAPSNSILPDPIDLCAGNTIEIFGVAIPGTRNIVSHQWTGSGAVYLNNAAIQEPIFNAAALTSGTYNLTYTIRDQANCTAVANTTVNVTARPQITNPPSNSTICSGQSFTYNPTSSGAANFVYESFSGAGISGNSGFPTPAIGAINDVLVNNSVVLDSVVYTMYPATAAGCSGPAVSWKVFVQPPSSTLTALSDRNNFCADDAGNISLSIQNADGQAIQWYTGTCGGTSIGTGSPLSITSPSITTTYYARYGSCPTCTSVTVNVDEVPAIATLNITQPTCATPVGEVVINAPLGANYEYSLDGGAFQSSTAFSSISSGPHNIVVRNTNNTACVATPANFVINPVPVAPSSPTLTLTQPTCTNATGSALVTSPLGADIAYSLDGGIFQSATSFPSIAPGNHSIAARLVSDTTCLSTAANFTIQAAPGTPAPVVITDTICSDNTYTLPDGSTTASSGIYNFTLPAYNGCDSLITVNLSVQAIPTVDAGASLDICESNPPVAITLSGTNIGGSASSGTWSIVSGSGTLSNTGAQNLAGINSTTFTPAAGFNGTVVLQLSTDDPSGPCNAVSATRNIIIAPLVNTSVITHD